MTTLCSGAELRSLGDQPRWYACYTRARHEYVVAEQFIRVGIEPYLPSKIEARQWSDRVKEVRVPLLPGYVFARFSLWELWRVLGTPGVVTVVGTGGHPAPISESEISQLRSFAEALRSHRLEAEVGWWAEAGSKVRVVRGALRGLEGIVVEGRGRARLLVRISAIRCALAVQLPVGDLQPIG